MSEKARFHPLALVIYFIEGIKQWLFLFVLLFFRGSRGDISGKFLGSLLMIVILLWAIAKYWTHFYQVTNQKIVLYHGILRQHELVIPYERIQTVKQRQWFFFKPFQLTQLFIETAGGKAGQAEATLCAVKESLLPTIENYRQSIKAEMVAAKDAKPLIPEVMNTEPKQRYEVTHKQIFLFGLTDLSIWAALVTVFAFINQVIPDTWVDQVVTQAEALVKVNIFFFFGGFFLILLVLMVVSLAKNFLQYHRFKVIRQGDALTIESGLLERKIQKIPLNKIQGIRMQQQVIRRFLGLTSVELLLAGGQEKEKNQGASKRLYFLPIIEEQEVYLVLNELLPEWSFTAPDIQYTAKERLWHFWRGYVLVFVPLVIIASFFQMGIALGLLLLLLILLGISWLDSRNQGFAFQGDSRLVLQGFIIVSKVQIFIERTKIQALSEKTTRWQYQKGVGQVSIYLKKGVGVKKMGLRYVSESAIRQLRTFYRE